MVDKIIFLLNDVYNASLDANEGGKGTVYQKSENDNPNNNCNGHLIVVILGGADTTSC